MTKQKIRPTILIVDDAPENIDVLAGILSADYDIKVAINGPKALKIAAVKPVPDLILLDIMMPEMDGYEVCSRLKESEVTVKIPVIFVTAKIEIADEQKGLELGAVDYIAKPVSPPIVLARIKNHLALKQAQDHLEELVEQRTLQLNQKMKELEARDSLIQFQMQSPDIKSASREILRLTAEVLGENELCLLFPGGPKDTLKIAAMHEGSSAKAAADNTVLNSSAAHQVAMRAFQEQKVQLTDDLMASPILYQDEVLGVVLVALNRSATELREEMGDTLWRMANEAAMVLRMARLSEDIQTGSVDFDALLDLAEQDFGEK